MSRDGSGNRLRVHVAAFGKHPGWDDHIEEIGLDCDPLVRTKRLLYSEGIAGNIDAGAWERLPDGQRLPGFKHIFYWRLPEGLVVGRMWASRDGKGRTKYPMVVCALVEGAPAWWTMRHALPHLAKIEEKVTQTGSAELVRLAIGEARRALDDEAALFAGTGATGTETTDADLIGRLVAHPTVTGAGPPPGLGLTRVLYEVEREMGAFRSSSNSVRLSRTSIDSPAAQHVRVPRGLGEGGEAARAWLVLMAQEVADAAPVLVLEAIGHEYLDIVVGDPSPPQLFCVKANAQALALTSDVPYSIEEAFVQQAGANVANWKQGKVRGGASASSPRRATGEIGDAGRSRKGLWIALGVGAAAIAALALVLSGGGSRSSPAEPGSQAPVKTADKTPPQSQAVPPSGAVDKPLAMEPPAPQPSPVVTEPAGSDGSGDPRAAWAFEANVRRTQDLLDRLEAELKEENGTMDPSLRQRLDRAAEKEVKFIRTATFAPARREKLVTDMKALDAELLGVAADAEARLAGVHGRVREYLASMAAQPQVGSAPMKAAWTSAMRGVDPALGWKEAKARSGSVGRSLSLAETAITSATRGELPELTEVNMGAVRAAFEGRAEAALRQAADGVVAGDESRVSSARSGLETWTHGAREILEGASELESLLAGGFAFGEEERGGGRSIENVMGEMRASPSWKDLEVSIGPLAARVDALAALENENDPARLLDVIEEANADQERLRASEVGVAWASLADAGWPTSDQGPEEAVRVLIGQVSPVVARVQDSARREAMAAASRRTGQSMWRTWTAAEAVSEANLKRAREAMVPLGVDLATVELPAWVRYNFARLALEEALQDAALQSGAARDEAQGRATRAFIEEVGRLGVADAGATGLVADIRKVQEAGGELDLARLGPGVAGWKLDQASSGDAVVYTLSQGGEHRLEFRRVEPPQADQASFVATTEMSVAQFVAIGTRAGRMGELIDSSPRSIVAAADVRSGPRTWVVRGETLAPPTAIPGDKSGGWVRHFPKMQGQEYYPPGLSVVPPSGQSPMQHVSPRAALFAAKLAGCRLPTSQEWKAAGGDAGGSGVNLRDAAWKRYFDFALAKSEQSPELPSAGIFGSAGKPAANDALPAVQGDDGVVWFQNVGEGGESGAFRHLVGNVAEFVLEDAAGAEGVATEVKAIGDFVKAGQVRVIGASALSPGSVEAGEPQAVTASQIGSGYSDVGFRLAFSAPRGAGAAGAGERLRAALGSHGYLNGK